MPKVDIAIPCFNYGRFLRDCVDSVLGQGVDDVRLLIIDNASEDDSLAIARNLAASDRRILVSAHSENLGQHASFNEAVDWAAADYLMILCSDDLLAPGALARMVSIMERHPDASFAYGHDVEWHEGSARPRCAGMPEEARWRVRDGIEFIEERCRFPDRLVSYGMILTRTRAHKIAGHYRPELPHTDDFEMLLRLACLGKVADSEAQVGIRRIHRTNKSRAVTGQRTGQMAGRIDAFESFFAKEGRRLREADRLHREARSSISAQAYWRGMKDLLRGRRSAIELLSLAFRLEPSIAVFPPLSYLSRIDRSLLGSIRSAG